MKNRVYLKTVKKISAFTLAELMVALLVVSIILLVSMPVITKKSQAPSVQAKIASPPGMITAYSATNAPEGWLLCDGAEVSRETYSALYSVIGDTYGAGNGSTTFNLPDLRGYFIRGLDGGAGVDADSASRTLGNKQDDSIQSFDLSSENNVSAGATTASVLHSEKGLGYGNPSVSMSTGPAVFNVASSASYQKIVPVNARVSTESRPKNIALNYIIKY